MGKEREGKGRGEERRKQKRIKGVNKGRIRQVPSFVSLLLLKRM